VTHKPGHTQDNESSNSEQGGNYGYTGQYGKDRTDQGYGNTGSGGMTGDGSDRGQYDIGERNQGYDQEQGVSGQGRSQGYGEGRGEGDGQSRGTTTTGTGETSSASGDYGDRETGSADMAGTAGSDWGQGQGAGSANTGYGDYNSGDLSGRSTRGQSGSEGMPSQGDSGGAPGGRNNE
jgi:hypothetical protein